MSTQARLRNGIINGMYDHFCFYQPVSAELSMLLSPITFFTNSGKQI